MLGQTSEIAPADRKLYALRGATATVEAIPLIAASIMSKKLAEDLTGLVLDVKTGAGAFLPTTSDALALARTMIDIGQRRGCRTVALLTDMDAPLGEACGNALEVAESVAVLRGGGPADVREVTLALAAEMLVLGGVAPDRPAARRMATAALEEGRALARFRVIVEAQGGDPRVAEDPWGVMAKAPITHLVRAERAGVVQRVEPRAIGAAIIALGGGRSHTDDVIDPAVGVMVRARPGQPVAAGDALLELHAGDPARLAAALELLREAVPVGTGRPAPRPLISHRVTAGGVEELPAAPSH
jgi:pyrimidine-nucleoside phosphorylase